jgi:tetratricopeptide (TPR) repeat protein
MDLLLASTEGVPPTAAGVISAVSGTAGVGKTAFATHWAHRVSDRFPDGQLYVNLRGYGPEKTVSPAEALARLLRSLGVANADIPVDLDDRAARFRSLAAGRRMLLVLDNARSAEQVRPLLPGTSSTLVLVTSRDTLPGLVSRDGARRVNLDLLPETQAIALLRRLIGVRVDDDPQASLALVQHCARLPLALRIVADLALSEPDVPLAGLVRQLADERGRLDLLDAGEDPYTAVRAVLSWSYRSLNPPEARAFRLLGLHPGRDFDVESAATLVENSPAQTRKLLEALVRMHLVERTRTNRYQMHDLLRVYAADLASEEEPPDKQEAALRRLFDFYLYTASEAMDLLYPQEKARRPVVPPLANSPITLTGEREALRWLDSEQTTLLAVAARTAKSTWASYTVTLSTVLSRFLDSHGHFDDAVALHTYAITASGELHDQVAEGRARHNLGTIYQRLGRYQEARDHLERALSLVRQVGQPATEAFTLSDLGLVLLLVGRYDEALTYLGQALPLFELMRDFTGQGQVLNNMGLVYLRQNQLEESLEHMMRSLELFRKTADQPREGYALNDIGVVHQRSERYADARVFHEEALDVARKTGDRSLEAAALNALGNANLRLTAAESVIDFHEQARVIAAQIGDRYEEAQAHEGLGSVHQQFGRTGRARDHWQQALAIYIELGSPDAERVRRCLSEPGG